MTSTRKFVINGVFHRCHDRLPASVDSVTLGDEEDCIFLPPGELLMLNTIVGHREIQNMTLLTNIYASVKPYDFTSSSSGLYTFETRNLFHYVESSTSAVVPIYAHTLVREMSISRRLGVERGSLPLSKLEIFVDCG